MAAHLSTDDRLELQQLVHRYCHLLDHGRSDAVSALFTADGEWSTPFESHVGTDALDAVFVANQTSEGARAHVCTTWTFDADDAGASGIVYLTYWQASGEAAGLGVVDGPTMIGEYHDRYTRTADGWRFASRHVVPRFVHRAIAELIGPSTTDADGGSVDAHEATAPSSP